MKWVAAYTDSAANLTSEMPYAFPAYDHLDGGTDRADKLTDADLLAPTLLNVPVKIRSYYALQVARPRLERALAHELLARDLATMDDSEVRLAIAPLYSVLDDARPWNVKATTLSKVLHRKRPSAVVLHDRWVMDCYLGTDIVPKVAYRSWADYMTLISCAVRNDLASQASQFAALSEVSRGARSLTAVRLLDILAWRSKGGLTGGAAVETETD